MKAKMPRTVRDRRFYPLSAYLRERFGGPTQRIPLDPGLTCPNRDGTVGTSGCAYCDNRSFRGAGRPRATVGEQMAEGIQRTRAQRNVNRFIAYFQSFTNTYAPAAALRALYNSAIDLPGVVGLAIGTRPDCAGEDVLDVVETCSRRVEVWIEYGLQSRHDRTLARIGRGHGYAAFADAVRRTRRRGIKVCAHVILGLPGETRSDMMATADALVENGVEGVKIHHLHIVRGTAMEREHLAGRAPVFAEEEYVSVVCDFLERLAPGMSIHRLVGEVRGSELLVAPKWRRSKAAIIQMVTEELNRRGSWQGKRMRTDLETPAPSP